MVLAQPDVARGLVLVGSGARLRIPAPLLDDARDRAASAPANQIAQRQISLDAVLSPQATHDAQVWLREHFGRSTATAAYADFVATNAFDVMDRIAEVKVPTLVVGGEDDRWTPPKFHRYLAEHIPNARLIMLPECGHYPFVENADAFNDELARFLGDVAGG
jgi:pimeloyl-ACP methyl ester carboxylesterase